MIQNQPQPLTKWEELARLLQGHKLDEFYGRTGWVRCEPYQIVTGLGLEEFWILIKTPQGTTAVDSRPYESVEDFWVRFLREIKPLRELGAFQLTPPNETRPVTESPSSPAFPEAIPQAQVLPKDVSYVIQVVAITEGRNGRVLVDPVLHRKLPGEAYQEKFRLHAEKVGFKGAKVTFRCLLVT